jgi:hypothetical protein
MRLFFKFFLQKKSASIKVIPTRAKQMLLATKLAKAQQTIPAKGKKVDTAENQKGRLILNIVL